VALFSPTALTAPYAASAHGELAADLEQPAAAGVVIFWVAFCRGCFLGGVLACHYPPADAGPQDRGSPGPRS
jgi:hypothetical protein